MTTASPSEPLLAEAASSAMHDFDTMHHCSTLQAMQEVLDGFSIHQGDRGELLVMLLLTMARDAVVHDTDAADSPIVHTLDLVKHLFKEHQLIEEMTPTFSPDPESTQTFKQMLAKSATHFNHFIKFQQQTFWTNRHLACLLARGAFILCATGQSGVDLVGMALRDKDKPISSDNLIVFLFQVNNDPHYTAKPDCDLFDTMDHFLLNLVGNDAKGMVVVRVITALAANTPSTIPIPRRDDKRTNFTVYDIWCAGLSPEVYAPIKNLVDTDTWLALLNASRGWEKLYKVRGPAAGLRRQENVGAADHSDHWQQWSSGL
jgi:hypothetical protein